MNENETAKASELDRQLQRWAERRQATKDLDGLRKQIFAAWCQEQSAPTPKPSPADRNDAAGRRVPWFAMGAAAALLIAAGMFLLFRNDSTQVARETPPDCETPPEFVWLNRDQLAEKARLLTEMERIFDNRLDWLAETDGRIFLEVQKDGSDRGAASRRRGMAVRIVVVRRDVDRPQWTPVWAADLVARQEQVICLTPESATLPNGAELSVWTYIADEQLIAVDSHLSLADLPVQSNFSGLQQSGVPTVVGAVERNGVQYRVFQTVAILDHEA